MEEQQDTASFSDHKLCAFLSAVLTVTSPDHPHLRQILPFGTRFQFSQTGVSFRSRNNVVLSPIDENPNADYSTNNDSEQCEASSSSELGNKRKAPEVSKKIGMRKRSIGLVNGSISVVHQLHSLVMNKCLMIDARLVRVEAGTNGEVRAVLLVDVYLPIALLSGWQFPRSGSVAGALFRHLR